MNRTGKLMKTKLSFILGVVAVLSLAAFLFFLFSNNHNYSLWLPLSTLLFTFSAQYRSILKSGKTFNEYFFKEEFRRKHNIH